MKDKNYDLVIGRLMRLRVLVKPDYYGSIDELIDALVVEAEKL